MPEEKSTKATPVLVEVHCDVEKKCVGHLRLVPGVRPKVVQPQLAWGTFEPEDSRYQLPGKVGRSGDYWWCPHCHGHLAVKGSVDTGEVYPPGSPKEGQAAPPVKGALVPVVLGRTQVQAG